MQIGFRQFVCVGIRKGFIRKADADELALGHHRLAYGASPFQDHGLASSMQDGFSQRPGNVIGHAIIVHRMYKKLYIECTKNIDAAYKGVFQSCQEDAFVRTVTYSRGSLLRSRLHSEPAQRQMREVHSGRFPLPRQANGPIRQHRHALVDIVIGIETPIARPRAAAILTKPQHTAATVGTHQAGIGENDPVGCAAGLLVGFGRDRHRIGLAEDVRQIGIELNGFPCITTIMANGLADPAR